MKDKKRNKSKVKEDLNQQLKDKTLGPKIRRGIYGRVFLIFFLILIQIAILFLFTLGLRSYIEIYFGSSLLLSILFVIYLANTKSRIEFKVSWILLLLFSPVVGIVTYIIFHTNLGNKEIKKRLDYLENKVCEFSPSVETSMEVLEKYPDFNGLGKYLADEGNAPIHTFSSVKYYKSGEDFLPDFLESIKNAKKFIFLEFFIIDVDESWITIFNLLKEKINQGVEVRLLYDGFGATTLATRKYRNYLKENGFNSHVFMPLIPFFAIHLNNRDHRKIAIFDGEVAYTGGLNLTNEYFNAIKSGKKRFNYWKDNGIRVEGPAILNYTQLFLQTWNLQTKGDDDYAKYLTIPYEHKAEDGLVIPYGDDVYNNEDVAEDVYYYIINNSKKYLHITTPYVVIDNQLQEALIFAAQRGVDVKIIVPSEPDHPLTFCVGKTYLKTLVDYGVKIYLYTKGFIHAKTFISDDVITTVGSVNLDYRSLYHHFETNTLMYNNSEYEKIENDFQETLKDCVQMTKDDYKKLPLGKRIIGRVFRVIAPLL